MDSIADSGTGGDAPPPITGASTDREDEDAGMGLLADGRRRREPQTITRPVPVLIRPAQAATSGTLTRPWVPRGSARVCAADNTVAPTSPVPANPARTTTAKCMPLIVRDCSGPCPRVVIG